MDSERPTQSRERLAEADIHEDWERDYLSPDLDRYYDAAFARIVGELEDSSGRTTLDLGCGNCSHTKRLARSDLSITAVDFSHAALARARAALDEAGFGGRVALRHADATNLPFPEGSFDNILMWGVLMHIPEADKALSEVARVLKPGGKLVLAENNARSLEVVFLDPLVSIVKRLIGRKVHERQRSRLGIEVWQSASTGGLLVRKTDIPVLVGVCRSLGLALEKRFAGQFTEAYTRVPTKSIKQAVHAFNRFYFKHVGRPGLSLSNILIFRKQG